MRWLILALLAFCASPILAWTHGGVRGDVVCNITTGVATGVGAGTCIAHPATCNGTADDAQAFADFNAWMVGTWQASHTGLVELFIPSGKTCRFLSVVNATVQDANCSAPTTYPFSCSWNSSLFAKGAKQLLVNFGGSTLKDAANADPNTNVFFDATSDGGICHHGIASVNGCSARINTVASGATAVFLKDTSLCSRYTVGNYAVVTGLDLQGSDRSGGYPPNPAFYDYVVITSKTNCGSTGEIDFDRTLTNSYKDSWPNYNTGSSGEADPGGPGSIYALPYWFDTQVEYRGGTIDQLGQTGGGGTSLTYRNITFTPNAFGACGIPSQNISWSALGGTWSGCTLELDKINVNVAFSNLPISQIASQSMGSAKNLTGSNLTVTSGIIGTPRNATFSNSTIASLSPGPTGFGRADSLNCTSCVIATLGFNGATESGTVSAGVWGISGQGGGPFNATMSAGVITIENAHGAVTWAVPGANIVWAYSGLESAWAYQISNVTQDVTNTYVTTNCVGANTVCGAGGALPVSSGNLKIFTHPAPKFNCTNCSGAGGLAVSNGPSDAALFSYGRLVYDVTWPTSSTTSMDIWGAVNTLTYTVANPYGGAGTLGFFPLYQFGFTTLTASGSTVALTPSVDLKTAGTRVVTPSGVTGSGGADSGLSVPSAVWITGPAIPNISSHPAWAGTITVTMQTDQGVVNP